MSFYHLTVLGGKTASGITVCIINCISGYHGLLISYHLFCRITNALDLKEHLQKTAKKLPAGIKRKVRLSDRACMSSPAPGAAPADCLTAPCVCRPPSCALPWACWAAPRSRCWTSRPQVWIPKPNSTCGEYGAGTREALHACCAVVTQGFLLVMDTHSASCTEGKIAIKDF